MVPSIYLIFCSFIAGSSNAASTYDQRQTGDLNVLVDLKDLQIIGLMKSGKEEYVDYDYAYDYSEMTIKPQNGTTPKPLNVTSTVADVSKDNSTTAAAHIETSSEAVRSSTEQHIETTDHPIVKETTILANITMEVTTKISELPEVSTAVAPVVANATTNNCKKGFVPNQKGGCEFKFQSASNALLKIIKLSQKLKRRENRHVVEEQ